VVSGACRRLTARLPELNEHASSEARLIGREKVAASGVTMLTYQGTSPAGMNPGAGGQAGECVR